MKRETFQIRDPSSELADFFQHFPLLSLAFVALFFIDLVSLCLSPPNASFTVVMPKMEVSILESVVRICDL